MNEMVSPFEAFEALERERLEFARQLHDRLAQTVTALSLSGERLLQQVEEGEVIPDEELQHFRNVLTKTHADVRFLHDRFRPPARGGPYSLVKALERLAKHVGPLHCELRLQSAVRVCEPWITLLVYRMAQGLIQDAIESGAEKLVIELSERARVSKLKLSIGGLKGFSIDPILLACARMCEIQVKLDGNGLVVQWPAAETG